ncbi:rrp12p [Saccharomyces arboricola H-6]|uniref:Rrp12p n=1 Tax=Saccharomyces arboricola (strain H-6 / AS 2.3317 / CBS 10644) TaxID=1160507 RepID=J8PGQ9_SACAR|nr:rrp12p [Saccharomyces arboricola H-6]
MDQDQVAFLLELEDKLAKIRYQVSSKLENQKHVAIILTAVEENIKGQATNDISKNIVNYIISFMSLLDQAVDPATHEIKDLQLASSSTYLLDLIFHYSPKPLLRSKFSEILTKIAPCITAENANAPLIRAAIGCLESLLIAQDTQAWNNTYDLSITPKRGLQGILELSLDIRPKVRKRALDAVYAILSNPPVAPTAEHVAAVFVADFCDKQLADVLNDLSNSSNKQIKAQKTKEDINSSIMRSLRLIASVISTGQWPSSQIEPLCDTLLGVTKSSEQYLVSASFECFESMFKAMAETTISSGLAENKYLRVLDTIFALKPSNVDTLLTKAWIAVVVKGMSTYSVHQPLKALRKIPNVFHVMSTYLASETPEVYQAASQCLISIISDSIQDDLLLYTPGVDNKTFQNVDNIISQIAKAFIDFLSIKYSHCSREILKILVAAFTKFKYRSNPHFLKSLKIVDTWRVNEEQFMDLRNEIELVIGASISAVGPEVVLSQAPLNLDNPSNERPGRAWLLPLIRDYTKNARLSTFRNELAPYIKSFQSKFDKVPEESIQLKIFETIVDQIWSTLPRFCELPMDLRETFTDEFASELSSLLYSQVELRTTICHSLKVLAESNLSYCEGSHSENVLLLQRFPISEAQKNIKYLSTKSTNLLAVLFNIYTQTTPNARSFILETIDQYLKITSEEDLGKTFNNVCGLLKNSMSEESSGNANKEKKKPQLTATLLDLIICMITYLPASSYSALFSIFGLTVNSSDALIQKRAYRIITKLSELESGAAAVAQFIPDIENLMVDNTSTVQTSAKAARLAAIKTIIDLLPLDNLSFIVRTVAEVILSTKDVNEKSRETAFDTLINMGKKMNEPNGIIKLSQIPGYDPTTPDQPSSISEFFKIISAGLIGESQHMVSSSITGYACLVFEFKNEMDSSILMDIYDTIELYLTSNSREIVKSAIGFTKVCVLGLPEELMRPKVPELLLKLLRWSHEHTGHFKAKVKHIIERLIRRFGYDYIEANFPEEDRKLLTNIRKARNRSKRKDEEDAPAAANSGVTTKGSKFMSAFDEAVYGSDNEKDNESDQEENAAGGRRKNGPKQFIVESGENPLDLLDSQTLAHISSTRPKKFNKNQNKARFNDDAFNFDSEGKLVVKGQAKSSTNVDDPLSAVTSGINAYLEAVKSGPVRGQRNKLKFKKNGKDSGDFGDEDERDGKPNGRRTDPRNKIGKGGKRGPKFKSRKKL